MFNCIKSFSYKMNISANQVSNALRMKALGNTKPDTPKIAGNFFVNKFTIHLSKNHPFGGPDNQSPDFDGTVENSANGSVLTLKMKSLKYLLLPIPFMIFVLFLAGLLIYDYFCNENLASLIFSIVPILLFAGVWNIHKA